MERTQIYLSPEQKELLLTLSKMKTTTMAELIRLAVEEYLNRHRQEYRLQVLEKTCGSVPEWKEMDGEEYVRKLRNAWGKSSRERWGEKPCDI